MDMNVDVDMERGHGFGRARGGRSSTRDGGRGQRRSHEGPGSDAMPLLEMAQYYNDSNEPSLLQYYNGSSADEDPFHYSSETSSETSSDDEEGIGRIRSR